MSVPEPSNDVGQEEALACDEQVFDLATTLVHTHRAVLNAELDPVHMCMELYGG